MSFLKIRHFILGVFLVIALLFVFEAGEKGVEHNSHSATRGYPKTFKSFPLFNSQVPQDAGNIQTQNTNEHVKTTDESKKEEDKKNEDKKNEEKKKEEEKLSPVSQENVQKNITTDSDLPLGASRVDSFWGGRQENNVQRDSASRIKTLPEISALYVPVYADQNLSASVLSDFSSRFPHENPQGKLYVLGSELSSSGTGETQYEILVYENQGFQFKGAFATTASADFPFRGIPTFQPAQQAQFQESARHLVFTDPQADVAQLLSQEAHVQAILKSAYHPQLDPQTFIGTDSQWNVDVYHVFPGIFLAETLR